MVGLLLSHRLGGVHLDLQFQAVVPALYCEAAAASYGWSCVVHLGRTSAA